MTASGAVLETRALVAGYLPEVDILHGVEVRVAEGEIVTIVGPNGAGKSTMLQVLAGIMRPSEGTVETRGAVSGLLTLGAGFDEELSGVENILLGGAFLGISDTQTRELMPEIERRKIRDGVGRRQRLGPGELG